MTNYRVIDGAVQIARRTQQKGTCARGLRVAIAAARYNEEVVNAMITGATAAWERQGGDAAAITLVRLPGAFELPLAAKSLALSGRFDAVVTLGCVIRGETAHFEYVAGEAARGVAQAAYETGVPIAFGVLTTENMPQALERALPEKMDKGGEAMEAALEMVLVLREIAAK
jgi:6,7-dimethyl-8-ribityllumazine synthase